MTVVCVDLISEFGGPTSISDAGICFKGSSRAG